MNARTKKIVAFASVAMMLSVCFAAGLYEQSDDEGTDGSVTLAVLAIFVGSAIIGWIATDTANIDLMNSHDTATPGGATDALRAQDRKDEAASIATHLNNYQALLSAKTESTSDTIKYISTYAQRQAEISVAELWSADTTYEINNILANSTVYDRLCTETNLASFYMTETFEPFNSLNTQWNETGDATSTYGGGLMSVGYQWSSGSSYVSNFSPYAEYGLACTVTSANNDRVYVRSNDGGFMYVSGGSAVMTAGNGDTYALTEGRNDLTALNIPSGVYELQSGRSYVGTMFTAATTDTVSLNAGLAMVTGTSTITYASYNGSGVDILSGTSKTASATLAYRTSYDGYNAATDSVDLLPSLKAVGTVLSSALYVMSNAADAAQVQWNVYDACGEANVLVSASSIIGSYENYSLSTDERTMLYIAAMSEISDYYQRNVDSLTQMSLQCSMNSLGLMCTGDIIDNNGLAVAEDVVFTPLMYLRDQTIATGLNNVTQTGIAAVWSKSADYTSADKEAACIIQLSSGYKFQIDSMTYQGTAVSSYTMRVLDIPDIVDPILKPIPTPTPTPELTDMGQVLFWFIVIVAALIAMIGLVTGNPIIIIVAVAGGVICCILSGTIAGWIW